MNNLRRTLSANGCYDYFRRLDLDPEILFYSDTDFGNPYEDHKWVLKENDDYTIVNAIPPEGKQNRLFWEEWFIHKGEVYHHILTPLEAIPCRRGVYQFPNRMISIRISALGKPGMFRMKRI